MSRLPAFLPVALASALTCGALAAPGTAGAQTAAAVEVDPPVVSFAGREGPIAVYDVRVHAASDQPKDRWHVSLRFCDEDGTCQTAASITDASADDPRTQQTWPDPGRGVPQLQVRLLAEQRGTLTAVWEIYTFHELVWGGGAKEYASTPVPIGPAPGGEDPPTGTAGGGAGPAGDGPPHGARDDLPSIRIRRPRGADRLAVAVRCSVGCRASAQMRVTRGTARRLGLDRRVVGRVDTRLRRGGSRRLWLRVAPGAVARLRAGGMSRVRVRARGRVIDDRRRSARDRRRAVLLLQ